MNITSKQHVLNAVQYAGMICVGPAVKNVGKGPDIARRH
jgi:hypothetical protein